MHHHPNSQKSREPINGKQLSERRRQMRLHPLVWLVLTMAPRPGELSVLTFSDLGEASAGDAPRARGRWNVLRFARDGPPP